MNDIGKLKTGRTTIYEVDTLNIIGDYMGKKGVNFSIAVNKLVKEADYLTRKIDFYQREKERLKGLNDEKTKVI